MADLWDELIREGDLVPQSVERAPELVAAVEQGTGDAAELMYLLAALSRGRPERLADRIRPVARAGAEAYAGLLDAEDPEVRAAAASVLIATEAGDADRLARLADDVEPLVRMTAGLAFGVLEARIGVIERLLEDEDPAVRQASALALQKVARIDQRVVQTLVRGAITEEGDAPRDRPPWDTFYPDAYEAVLQLGFPMLEPALPFLLDRIGEADRVEALGAAELALELAFGAPRAGAKLPKRLTPLQRDVVERLAAGSDAWKSRAQMESLMSDYGLPEKRRELERWLKTT
jgi:HEAT repeat protein